ncbi:MAG TPA: TolC family protein [Kofleriaceae bacterium]|nr:TolC family protein [Kofleriaceae bacterium]
MRRVSAIVLASLLVPRAAAIADDRQPVTLASLLDAGRRFHPTLAREPLIAEALAIQDRQIAQAWLPRLSLSAQATWQSDVTSVSIPLPGVSITPPAKDQYRVTLELQQTIWDGGAVAGQEQVAARRADVERQRVELDWYQVRQRIVQLYFAGLVQQELARQADTLDHHLADVEAKAEVAREHGVAIDRDVLLVQARQLEAEQASADANAQLAAIRRSLGDLTGAPPEGAFDADPGCAAGDAAGPGAGPVTAADVHRPELAALDAQRDLLEAQDHLDAIADRPRVGAFATGGYGRPGLNALDDAFEPYFIGGVQVTVPLTHVYAGTRRKARAQVSVQEAQLGRQRDAVVTQINVELDTQRAEVARLDRILALDAKLVDVRERARGFTETQLDLGTATMTDLINDLTQEDAARSKLTVHQAQRALACHQLALIVGDL